MSNYALSYQPGRRSLMSEQLLNRKKQWNFLYRLREQTTKLLPFQWSFRLKACATPCRCGSGCAYRALQTSKHHEEYKGNTKQLIRDCRTYRTLEIRERRSKRQCLHTIGRRWEKNNPSETIDWYAWRRRLEIAIHPHMCPLNIDWTGTSVGIYEREQIRRPQLNYLEETVQIKYEAWKQKLCLTSSQVQQLRRVRLLGAGHWDRYCLSVETVLSIG